MIRRRVLLVGGDPESASVCREFLRLRYYDIESIDYCDDALMALRRQRFDAVLILSLDAPWAPWRAWSSLSSPARHIEGSSAILFLKQIRGLLDPPPVILVSGRSDAKATALANGAVAFLLKPIKPVELEEALQNVPPSSHVSG